TPKDLEGPAYEIVKVFHLDANQLQYQMEECYRMLNDQVGEQINRFDVNNPLPLGGEPGFMTIQSEFFFNHDLDYLCGHTSERRPA
ncbi:hypothetical protein, partial [Salmonella enterica]|uniref:hypothetical protein n=1 Tax=Salmonella enterica TaxID=28901 RepID=UPI0020C3E5EB